MKHSILIFLALIFLGCTTKNTEKIVVKEVEKIVIEQPRSIAPKNIILMIGDGMGLSQISAGLYSNGNKIAFEAFNHIGLHKSYSADDLITDSAAGATAFSCGQKTYNGAIAVDINKKPITTILQEAETKGLKTGLVSTSTIVHATPASFIAHNESRKNYEAIALDFLKTDVDIFIGGGSNYFKKRKDDRNLYDDLKANGYTVSDYFEKELEEMDFSNAEKVAYLTSASDPLKASQGRDYLSLATAKTLDFLERDNEKGFFLMIEGSQIDWGGHANDGEYIVTEMLDFNKAIHVVLNYLEKHPETLLVITADHETGGLAINKGSKLDSLDMKFTSDYHTADLVPVFAKGPSAEMFRGIYENTAIYHKMRAAFGWK